MTIFFFFFEFGKLEFFKGIENFGLFYFILFLFFEKKNLEILNFFEGIENFD